MKRGSDDGFVGGGSRAGDDDDAVFVGVELHEFKTMSLDLAKKLREFDFSVPDFVCSHRVEDARRDIDRSRTHESKLSSVVIHNSKKTPNIQENAFWAKSMSNGGS